MREKEGLAVPPAGGVAHTRLDDIIRAREEEFFRELAVEEHEDTHPLMHMVASQQKLRSIGVPYHQLDPRAAVKKSQKAARMSPYERPQTLVEYAGRARSKPPILAASRTMLASGGAREGANSSGDKITSSAGQHRHFLDTTLTAVHEQLESTALVEICEQTNVN